MKFTKTGKIVFEKHEPYLRSCWKCNNCHEGLKKVNMAHMCFECGNCWIFDKFFHEIGSDEKMVEWLKSIGLKAGESTRKIDKGYRVYCIKITKKKVKIK